MIDQLITMMQAKVPAFCRRVLTFEDFLEAAANEGVVIELKRHPSDEQIIRKPLAKIILNTGLSEKYRTFVGFHAFAHWVGHAAENNFYLGSPGWLDAVELEASAIGYLALAPHPQGPPYPRLVRAGLDRAQLEMRFDVEYPSRGLPDSKVSWRQRTTRLVRPGQTEFRWSKAKPAQGPLTLPGMST